MLGVGRLSDQREGGRHLMEVKGLDLGGALDRLGDKLERSG